VPCGESHDGAAWVRTPDNPRITEQAVADRSTKPTARTIVGFTLRAE